VSEEAAIGRELKLNGQEGSLRLERGAKGLRARVVLPGVLAARPGEACAVALQGGEPVDLVPQGRPEGLARYELPAPSCPLTLEVVEGGVWLRSEEAACAVEAAGCRADPRGLWGPEGAALVPQARALEAERGQADKAVRDNYRALSARASPAELRTVVAEQAAFSAQREMACRGYAREAAHGFCHARFTEARAAAVAARLGLSSAPPPRRAATPPAARPPSPGSPASGSGPSDIR
jgi:hypothetical protein